jgi:uridine phosphorylase
MIFYDPDSEPLLFPEKLVSSLSLGGLNRHLLTVKEKVLILFLKRDLKRVVKFGGGKLHLAWKPYRTVYQCEDFTTALSPFGAPNAVALAEELYAFGGRVFLTFGYCGSLSPNLQGGDLFLPQLAIREEGTSYHYLPPEEMAKGSEELIEFLYDFFKKKGFTVKRGTIWTTDAIYRETKGKIETYSSKGCMAVDMETSAMFCWGKFKNAKVASLLVVSDGFIDGKWQPFFKNSSFILKIKKIIKSLTEAYSALKI